MTPAASSANPVAWPEKYEERDVPVGWIGLSAYENGWNAAIDICREAAAHPPAPADCVMVPREPVDFSLENYISQLRWSDAVTDYEKTLVVGNLRNLFAILSEKHNAAILHLRECGNVIEKLLFYSAAPAASNANLTFETWLRTTCFQQPTPEAYYLAKCAWNTTSNAERKLADVVFDNLPYLENLILPAGHESGKMLDHPNPCIGHDFCLMKQAQKGADAIRATLAQQEEKP